MMDEECTCEQCRYEAVCLDPRVWLDALMSGLTGCERSVEGLWWRG